jgi:hypothetical protein
MGGKAKPTSHTRKELDQKAKNATCNRGGGAAGAKDRQGGAAGHSKFSCPSCGNPSPDNSKSAEAHWDSKHSKMGPFVPDAWINKHDECGGVTTQGTAVVGSKKSKHK